MLMSFVQCSHIAAAMQTYGYLPGRRALPLAGSLQIVGPADSSRLSSAGLTVTHILISLGCAVV